MDEAGTRITGFRRDWGLFKIVRDVLASHGVDIESITDPEELENLIDLHRETIHELLSLKIQSEAHKSTERALLATVTRRDTEEADRLSDKLKRRRAMGMRVVDGGKWE
jgi:hypothetical protein